MQRQECLFPWQPHGVAINSLWVWSDEKFAPYCIEKSIQTTTSGTWFKGTVKMGLPSSTHSKKSLEKSDISGESEFGPRFSVSGRAWCGEKLAEFTLWLCIYAHVYTSFLDGKGKGRVIHGYYCSPLDAHFQLHPIFAVAPWEHLLVLLTWNYLRWHQHIPRLLCDHSLWLASTLDTHNWLLFFI